MQKRNQMNYAALLSVLLAQLAVGPALAQSFGDDPIVALPEVLIIVDSSGSMRFGAYAGTGTIPSCWDDQDECVGHGKVCKVWGTTSTCGQSYCCKTWNTTSTTYRSRWELIREVLTGDYDASYIGTCTNQQANGLLDAYKDQIRFGFAEFDNDTSSTWDYGTTCGHEGLRNRAATSGALIDLVNPNSPDDVLGHNVIVQTAACGTDAINGTPLSPALSDANYYFTNWHNEVTPIYNDPLTNCRQRYVILLTDGQDDADSQCQTAPARAAELFAKNIITFVVGFGDDATMIAGLNAIAQAGSGKIAGRPETDTFPLNAFMATDKTSLKAQLTLILNTVLSSTNSRTTPTSAPSITSSGQSYRYKSYFKVSGDTKSWKGHIIRETITLNASGNPTYSNPIDFADTLASQSYASRKIFTATQDPRSLNYIPHSPSFDPNDYKLPRSLGANNIYTIQSAPNTEINPLMCVSDTVAATTKDYVRGNRAAGDQTPILGDVFHSNPVVVPPPSPIAPDYRFGLYYLQNKDRYTMLYVGANDGMLHAFVAEDKTNTVAVGTELWGFIPTNLLSNLSNLMAGHSYFVDGSPVVQDVLFRNLPLTDKNGNIVYQNGQKVMGAYRTVLVSGERGGGSAYFALDVTDPKNPKYLWEYRTDVFLDGTTAANYTSTTNQCGEHRLETWAQPVIGDVWLRNSTDNPMYISKTVVAVPGGYFAPALYANMTSCIDMMQTVISAGSFHVIDIETGQLIEKFAFTDDATATSFAAALTDFETRLASGSTAAYSHFAAGSRFQTSDYSWTTPGKGWQCGESRQNLQNHLYVPTDVLSHCTTTNNSGSISYQKACCYIPPSGTCVAETDTNACSYRYTQYTDGRIEVWLKTTNCSLVPTAQQGQFDLLIGGTYGVETDNADPAGYDTTMGQYLTRVFAPTSLGKVWRVNLANGKYIQTNPEGSQVVAYTDGTTTYNWDVGRDSANKPKPWFDTVAYTNNIIRPIMVPPSLALDYQRNLVLFFGTGIVDSLQYAATQDYFFAVKETRALDTDGFYSPTNSGQLFCATSSCSTNPLAFAPGERMFGKPLIINGKVFFTTYLPAVGSCNAGQGTLYGLQFDDFTQGILDSNAKTLSLGTGTPSSPTVIWGPGKTEVQIQSKDTTTKLTKDEFGGTARIAHWAKVL